MSRPSRAAEYRNPHKRVTSLRDRMYIFRKAICGYTYKTICSEENITIGQLNELLRIARCTLVNPVRWNGDDERYFDGMKQMRVNKDFWNIRIDMYLLECHLINGIHECLRTYGVPKRLLLSNREGEK